MLSRIAFKTVKNVNLHQQIWCPSVVGALRTSSSCPAPSGTSRSAATSASGSSDEEFSYYAKSGTKFPWEGPERDVVNFPRPVQPVYPGKVRFLFVPEEWFQFFYKKTGVTGPYTFGFGLFTYLMSKELWVMDHEYFYVYAVAAIFYLANNKFGDKIAASLDKHVDESEAKLKALRSEEVANLEAAMKEEQKLQWQAEGQKMLIEAKKENVAIQQEAAYRERAMQVYNEVRKRLEFHSQKQMMERRVSQKHMVSWVISQVLKSITPEQEKDTLRKCLSDLQGLAARS